MSDSRLVTNWSSCFRCSAALYLGPQTWLWQIYTVSDSGSVNCVSCVSCLNSAFKATFHILSAEKEKKKPLTLLFLLLQYCFGNTLFCRAGEQEVCACACVRGYLRSQMQTEGVWCEIQMCSSARLHAFMCACALDDLTAPLNYWEREGLSRRAR